MFDINATVKRRRFAELKRETYLQFLIHFISVHKLTSIQVTNQLLFLSLYYDNDYT